MGKTSRRQRVIVVPDKYWKSSYNNIEWIYKEKKCQKV